MSWHTPLQVGRLLCTSATDFDASLAQCSFSLLLALVYQCMCMSSSLACPPLGAHPTISGEWFTSMMRWLARNQQRAELIKPSTFMDCFSGALRLLGPDCVGRLTLGHSCTSECVCASALPSHLGEPVQPLPASSASSCMHPVAVLASRAPFEWFLVRSSCMTSTVFNSVSRSSHRCPGPGYVSRSA